MNMQETFDKSVIGIIKQGKKSATKSGSDAVNLYRKNTKTACAIGILLDEETGKKWDSLASSVGFDVTDLVRNSERLKVEIPGWMNDKVDFLQELQNCHDECTKLRGKGFLREFRASINCGRFDEYGIDMTNVNHEFEVAGI